MAGDRIRFGMIGCGNVTEVKSGPAFGKIPGASLDMVMRRDAEKLRDYAARHKVPRWSTDYLDILKDPDIDAVYIATPPDTHAFYTIEAARHGKAVYVEKPMGRTVAECEAMRRACLDAGVPLFVAYYRRGQPKFLKAKELIASGALGSLRSFSYQYACPPPAHDPLRPWLLCRESAGGGLLYDIGSHMINMLLFLLGEPLEVIGRSARLGEGQGSDDVTSAVFRFRSGVQGVMQLSFCAAEQADRLWIAGSGGSMALSVMSNDPVEVSTPKGEQSYAFEPLAHVQQPYIGQVVRTLQGKGSLEQTGSEGLLTQKIIEAVDVGAPWRA